MDPERVAADAPFRLLGQLDLSDQAARCRIPPRELDPARLGLTRPPTGPMAQVAARGHIPLIDVGTLDLIRRGRVEVWPGIERFTADGAVFADGTCRPLDAVVLAPGYRPRVDAFLTGAGAAVGSDGRPTVSRPCRVCTSAASAPARRASSASSGSRRGASPGTSPERRDDRVVTGRVPQTFPAHHPIPGARRRRQTSGSVQRHRMRRDQALVTSSPVRASTTSSSSSRRW
jgi:hypothetical protein